jgi:CBS domain-containing protein
VRIRYTLQGDGASTSVRTVLCPTRGETVGLAACADCVRCDHIALDRDGRGTVTCRPDVAPPTIRWTSTPRRISPSPAECIVIADVMTREVTCVTREVSLEALTSLFLERGFGAAPVVDGDGFPVGVVSKTDLVREGWENGDEVATRAADEMVDGMHMVTLARAMVGDVMTPLAYTLQEDEPLSRAAAMMDVERVHHLPVVSADGRVVGMLSSLDFVRWVAEQ